MKRKGRKILILGGNGFIGANLACYFADNDEDISSFDLQLPALPCKNVRYISGDFFDDNTLEGLVKEHDIIYHAISTINPGNSSEVYMRGYEKDFLQSVKLCDFVKKFNKKMIFLSSGGTVYGEQQIQPVVEDCARFPINHYGAVKCCIETVMQAYRKQFNTELLIARIANPYGPGQDYKKGVGLIDAVLKSAISGETATIWGDGEVVRDYIYIDDVCACLAELADYDGSELCFNISTQVGSSVNDILGIIREIYPSLKVNYKEGRTVDIPYIVLENHKIQGIQSKRMISVRDGIKRYARFLEGLKH